MNINGLFQFMNTDICDSFFRDVTTENMTETLDQLMQNPDFLALTQVFVDDVSILRQKVVTKLGQLCKKKKIVKEEETVPLPVETPKPRLIDGYELIKVQYAIDDATDLRENTVEDPNADVRRTAALGDDAENVVKASESKKVPDTVEPCDESLGTHIGEGIYLQHEGHVIKMTTPQFVVYY